MLSKFVKAGDRIELQKPGKNKADQEEKKIYNSRIQGILTEDTMEITMPMEQTKLILLPVDSEYDLVIYGDNSLYQCYARITDRYKSNNVYILVVELVTNLRKFQRREFYRFSCALELDVRALVEDESKAIEEKRPYELDKTVPMKKGVIVDISGGGIRFMSNQSYEINSLLLCKFSLIIDEERKQYEIIGTLLAKRELPNRPGTFEHRVQFLAINETVREEIIRFIFDQERKERKKRNGS